MEKTLTLIVDLPKKKWHHRYTDVTSFEVFPKEKIKNEVDEVSFIEMSDFVFRMYFKDGDTASFNYDENFTFGLATFQ